MLAVDERSRKRATMLASRESSRKYALLKLILQPYMKTWGTLYYFFGAGLGALAYLVGHVESTVELLQMLTFSLFVSFPFIQSQEYCVHVYALHRWMPRHHERHHKHPSIDKYNFTPTIPMVLFHWAILSVALANPLFHT